MQNVTRVGQAVVSLTTKNKLGIVSVSISTYSECVYIPHRNYLNQKL